DYVTQRRITLALGGLMSNQIALGEILDRNDGIGHINQSKSAKLFSIFRNCRMPSHRKKAATLTPSHRPGRYSWLCPPSRHQRNPSMTATIGLREYSRRHCSGMMLELKPTGDTYRPSCTMNGIT